MICFCPAKINTKIEKFAIIFLDIENLTHKTGNYKQFDIFVAMLQSGLLKVISFQKYKI